MTFLEFAVVAASVLLVAGFAAASYATSKAVERLWLGHMANGKPMEGI